MKKVFIFTAFAALFTFVACQKDIVNPSVSTDETSVSTDIADVETIDPLAGRVSAEERGASLKIVSITAANIATVTSGDPGCTYTYKGYAISGSSFTVVSSDVAKARDWIVSVSGNGVSGFSSGAENTSHFTINTSHFTFGSIVLLFKTNAGKNISATVKVVGSNNGVLYGTTTYALAAMNISSSRWASIGDAITATTDYPAVGNILIIGGKRAIVGSYQIGKNLPRDPHKPILNKCTYTMYACGNGTSVSWSGTGKFPSGATAIVR